ncbi:MAG: histidinol-phosphatase HisJ family protein [Lachnospiraceae bacterium]|nr:histidinol-phosphatase HisJ family protein [Lachnospiraceae bacterium]
MPILCDSHIHSHHSGDSEASMESMIEAAIAAGLDTLVFTEHNDFQAPPAPDLPKDAFLLNADSYLYELLQMKERYSDRIRLLFGVELGLQPCCVRENAVFAKSHDFDFIIGSAHYVGGKDPYYPETFEGTTPSVLYRQYFEEFLESVRKTSNFDVCGHLDYVFRYGPRTVTDPDPAPYMDVIEAILKILVDREKGLEINTKSAARGMKEFHPSEKILRRYKELGGEIVTVGSDAHSPKWVGSDFEKAAELLKRCGFEYYCVFEKRTPEYHRI